MNEPASRHGIQRAGALAGLLVLALVSAACLEVTPPRQVLWQATLQGADDQPFATGNAAAISGSSATEVNLSVAGLTDGVYRWAVRRGDCDAPGEILGGEGAYPLLSVTEGEQVDANAVTSARMVTSSQYCVEVRAAASGASVACGNFVLWEG